MESFRNWVGKDLTLSNIIIALFLIVQGGQYAMSWVWAQDNNSKIETARIESLEQTVKAQHEAIETQHTFSEVVNVRLSNIEQQLRDLKDLILKEGRR